jgi:glycosyltransferase involved in cell wall biosynthesis
MKLGVLICVFNGAKTLNDTLNSIKIQTTYVSEVVIVDDASSDKTHSIIKAWAKKLPIKLVTNKKNLGLSKSLSYGMRFVTADWVFRIDADDVWKLNHVKLLLKGIKQDRNIVLLSSQANLLSAHEMRLGISSPCSNKNVRSLLMCDNPLIHSCTAFKKSAYFKVGGYRNVKWEDYDLWIRLLSIGKLAFIESPTIHYLVNDKSLSRIGYIDAIEARWHFQKLAIKIFFFQHPLHAILCYLFFGLRFCLGIAMPKKLFCRNKF